MVTVLKRGGTSFKISFEKMAIKSFSFFIMFDLFAKDLGPFRMQNQRGNGQ